MKNQNKASKMNYTEKQTAFMCEQYKDNPTIEKTNPNKDELEIILPSDMEIEEAMQEFAEGGGVEPAENVVEALN